MGEKIIRGVWLTLRIVLVAAITVLIIEGMSRYFFLKVFSKEIRENALYVAEGTLPEGGFKKVAIILPDLWSNYRPNPSAPNAMDTGWRYGGHKKSSYRILCLGGSTTWSSKILWPIDTYPAYLEAHLRQRGYDVDVINGGAPYYNSAELVGTFAFRGVHEKPDLVVLHTGGNDIEPLLSPRDYKNDYSHYRTAQDNYDSLTANDKFRTWWQVPSWTVRALATAKFKPSSISTGMLGSQLDHAFTILRAEQDISEREPTALRANIKTIVGAAKIHDAKSVLLTFKIHEPGLDALLLNVSPDAEKRARMKKIFLDGMAKNNTCITESAKELGCPLIPFHTFETSDPELWADQCHLHKPAIPEKALFVANALIASGIIPEEVRTLPDRAPDQ
jgi:hypothetical protein